MKIFLSLKVPRENAEQAAFIAAFSEKVQKAGHLPFVAAEEIAKAGMISSDKFMPFIRAQLAETDIFVLLYHPELRGGLIEAGIAYERGIPIRVYCRKGEKISSSLLGCADKIIEYNDMKDLQKKILLALTN